MIPRLPGLLVPVSLFFIALFIYREIPMHIMRGSSSLIFILKDSPREILSLAEIPIWRLAVRIFLPLQTLQMSLFLLSMVCIPRVFSEINFMAYFILYYLCFVGFCFIVGYIWLRSLLRVLRGKVISSIAGLKRMEVKINVLAKIEGQIALHLRSEKQKLKNLIALAQEAKVPAHPSEIMELKGEKFEQFLQKVFSQLNYKVHLTPSSGDYGIDLIVEMRNKKIGFQVKGVKKPVGIRAIQEAIAGKEYYNLDEVGVITNSSFTNNAKKLAQKTGVKIYDFHWLVEHLPSLSLLKEIEHTKNKIKSLHKNLKKIREDIKTLRSQLGRLNEWEQILKRIDKRLGMSM